MAKNGNFWHFWPFFALFCRYFWLRLMYRKNTYGFGISTSPRSFWHQGSRWKPKKTIFCKKGPPSHFLAWKNAAPPKSQPILFLKTVLESVDHQEWKNRGLHLIFKKVKICITLIFRMCGTEFSQTIPISFLHTQNTSPIINYWIVCHKSFIKPWEKIKKWKLTNIFSIWKLKSSISNSSPSVATPRYLPCSST